MTETEKDDLKDIFMAKLQYNVRNDELIHIDYVDDAVNSLLQDLVKKLNIDDVSKRLEPNYDNPKNGFVKLRTDDCGNEIG